MTEGKVGKEVKDQAITIAHVMTEPRHYGMHRHFTASGSILMFGGGIRGFVVRARPPTSVPADDREPGHQQDLHASMYHALGIAPDTSVRGRKAGQST